MPLPQRSLHLTGILFAVLLSSCKGPMINIGTPEPIKVDIEMRLDVYQFDDNASADSAEEKIKVEEVVERQRNRMEEIQELKNNRFVGESHLGTLFLRAPPAGDYGDYVKKTVEAENQDRVYLMRHIAKKEDKFYHEVQLAQWKDRVERSFADEWVEIEGEKEGTYQWIQKPKKG